MKKIGCLFLTTLMITSLLAGCSQAQKDKSNDGEKNADKSTIQFWGAIPPETGPQELIDQWNEEHPEIQVEYTRFVNDDSGNTKLETAILAGKVDLFVNYTWDSLHKRISNGMLEPIDCYLEQDQFDLEENFGPHPYEVDGKKYFVPSVGGPSNFIQYNADMFKDANITIPENWTWDEYMDIAKQLTRGEGNDKIYGTASHARGDIWANPVLGKLGGDYMYKNETESNFNNEYFKKALDMEQRMVNVDQSKISIIDQKASKMDVSAIYTQGNLAMMEMNYRIRDIKNLEKYPHDFKTSFAPYPVFDGQTEIYSGGLREWLAISSNSMVKDKAWKFLKYFATDGFYPMCKSGRIPAWKNADKTDVAQLILGENADQIFDVDAFIQVALDNPSHRDAQTTMTVANEKVMQIMTEESEKMLLDDQTADEALKNMKDRADKVIQQESN